ncbi:hypothetical protein [Streptomyces violascens]|uniref:hypothetical protein n=1 Tax=Streptomyces violascens TaxID=67381 RepID=UPI00167B3E49|nr:hypothetical protein [Streptomyces violascens]
MRWVPLAPLTEPIPLTLQLAGELRLFPRAGRCPDDLVAGWLADKRLLVLDTCEHLLDACTVLVWELLAAAPGLRVLATSRRPLGLPGERQLALGRSR